jgi:predicted nucleic acid-binding protein
VDTNVFFYAVDARDPVKQKKARELISALASAGDGVISTQVIQEFANNVIKKLQLTANQTTALCEAFADHTVVKPDLALVRDSLRLMDEASISFWDAAIVAAAAQSQCKFLFTEDLSPGHRIGGVQIRNPFL